MHQPLAEMVDQTARGRVQDSLLTHPMPFPSLSIDGPAGQLDLTFRCQITNDATIDRILRAVLEETGAYSYVLWDHGRMHDRDDGFDRELVICMAARRKEGGRTEAVQRAYEVHRRGHVSYLREITNHDVLARLEPMFASLGRFHNLFTGPVANGVERTKALQLVQAARPPLPTSVRLN